VIVTTGSEAYRRRDGVAVVPAALLGSWSATAVIAAPSHEPAARPGRGHVRGPGRL